MAIVLVPEARSPLASTVSVTLAPAVVRAPTSTVTGPAFMIGVAVGSASAKVMPGAPSVSRARDPTMT